jgi:RsiW-degrading membrane proteinase PrsW (M82 family)
LVLLIALMALGLSFLVNKCMLRLLREHAAILGAPVFEELLKTLPAYYWNRPVFHVHFFFGLGEALYDFANSSRNTGRWAAFSSIISHCIFGAVTELMLHQTGRIILTVPSAIAIHCAWNFVVMRAGNKKKKVVD